MKAEAGKQATVRGDVTPLVGHGEGRVVVLDGDTEYRVVPRGAGVDLVDHLGAQIEVEGTVTEDEDGGLRIHVRSYRLVDVFDDDAWYEDERA